MSHDLLVKLLVAYYWIAVLISLLVEYRKKYRNRWPDYPGGVMCGLGWATIGLVMLASVMAFVP